MLDLESDGKIAGVKNTRPGKFRTIQRGGEMPDLKNENRIRTFQRTTDQGLLRRVRERSTFRHRFSFAWTSRFVLRMRHLNWHGSQLPSLPIEIDVVLRLHNEKFHRIGIVSVHCTTRLLYATCISFITACSPQLWTRASQYFPCMLFLPRCMECRRGLTMRIPSVRLSVCLSVCLSVRPSNA